MNKVTLKCRLITPMFMFGADNVTPELRASEFKGMMRWWWRAIMARDSIEVLREEEGEIFGGVVKVREDDRIKEKHIKSKLKILIDSKLEPSDVIEYQPLPHHKAKSCLVDGNSECRKAFRLKAIKQGKEIDILVSYPDKYKTEVESLIYLTFVLGGFGKRSRRGFGSFEIISPSFNIDLGTILNKLKDINSAFELGSSSIDPSIKAIKNRGKGGDYPWIREIIISGKKFSSSDDVLKAIGRASHKNRNPSLGSGNPRMASPIYVSVVKMNDGLYPIITILNNYFPKKYPKCDLSIQKNFVEDLL
ncbi:MAG: type III-B CRISPR module RAMP protein Cmr1 [Candidatus Kryptonium sp.]